METFRRKWFISNQKLLYHIRQFCQIPHARRWSWQFPVPTPRWWHWERPLIPPYDVAGQGELKAERFPCQTVCAHLR